MEIPPSPWAPNRTMAPRSNPRTTIPTPKDRTQPTAAGLRHHATAPQRVPRREKQQRRSCAQDATTHAPLPATWTGRGGALRCGWGNARRTGPARRPKRRKHARRGKGAAVNLSGTVTRPPEHQGQSERTAPGNPPTTHGPSPIPRTASVLLKATCPGTGAHTSHQNGGKKIQTGERKASLAQRVHTVHRNVPRHLPGHRGGGQKKLR